MDIIAYYLKFRGRQLDFAVKVLRETYGGCVSERTLDVFATEAEAEQKVKELRAERDEKLSQVYRNNIPT